MDGLLNVPVVCGQITTGTQITITGVSMGNDAGGSFAAGDNSGAVLTIESNPYATQGICDDLYTALNGLVYFPYTAIKALYDPAAELGDQVIIGDKVHSAIYDDKDGKATGDYAWQKPMTRQKMVTLLYRYSKMMQQEDAATEKDSDK